MLIDQKASYKLPEEQIEDDTKTAIVTYEPLGVVAAICPWNCTSPDHESRRNDADKA